MSSVGAAKKNRLIAFRVTDEEYTHIEKSALAHDDDVNTWCRELVVTETRDGCGLTKTEQLLYEEIARVRYLIGHGFRMMFSSKEATAAAWRKYTADIDQHSEIIAADLLSRRKPRM